jgi:hypothetical protein
LLVPGGWVLVIALFALIGLSMTEHQAEAQAWSLTKAQRKAYLNYYAPVILKRGDENNDKEGHDWLTNFDFDQDNNFSTNRVNWLKVEHYVAASAAHDAASPYSTWRIRPTLYTALLEYMEGSSKSLVLLYHVYNASDKDGSQIHDWERIEIIVRGVRGNPGATGEYVNTVTVTIHGDQIMRRYYDSGLNFMQTTTGRHVLIWQADESDDDSLFGCPTHAHELRFVTNSYTWIANQRSSNSQAEVNINDKDEKKNVHYVFVPEESSSAVSAWGAQPLNYTVASALYSGVDNGDTISWSRARRITYELQDWADILPTHWQYSTWYKHWLDDVQVDVLLESPIINEGGQSEVSAGMQLFYALSRDSGSSSLTDGRDGYPSNFWFYGAYAAELDPDCPHGGADDFPAYSGSGVDSYGRSRGAASGYYNSHGAYWWQHDYFVHSGAIDSSSSAEAGQWLVGAWYTAANGGFDGRWVQLFDDRPGQEPIGPLPVPLNVTVTSNAPSTTIDLYNSDCIPITWTTNISGGIPAYNSTMYENGVSKGARTTYTGSYCNVGTNSSRTVTVSATVTDSSSPVQPKSASAPTITIRSHAVTATPFNVTVTSNAPSTIIDLYETQCISITWTTNISGGTSPYNSTMYLNSVSQGARTTYSKTYCNAGTNSSVTAAVSATVTDSSSQSKSASAPTITVRSHYYSPSTGCYTVKNGKLIASCP